MTYIGAAGPRFYRAAPRGAFLPILLWGDTPGARTRRGSWPSAWGPRATRSTVGGPGDRARRVATADALRRTRGELIEIIVSNDFF